MSPDRSQADAPGEAEEHPPRLLGRGLDSRDATTALVHFYRGEVTRSNIWRTRLDATTNWAVVTTGAALTFAFGGPGNSPVVLLIVSLLVVLFLFIEARRYRYYELWTYRVRLIETNFFTGLLSPHRPSSPDWTDRVTQSLLHPSFPITLLEALGRRYRRNYAPLFLILTASWLLKITIHPTHVTSIGELMGRARVGPFPGGVVLLLGVAFNLGLLGLGIFTVGLRQSEGEVFGPGGKGFLRFMGRIRAATREALEVDLAAFTPAALLPKRKQLVYIISDEIEGLRQPLLTELKRGVTLIKGVGMYSGKEHGILMCVVQGRQVDQIKMIIQEHDPDAFVVITAAQDVRGEGFRPLEL